MGQQAAAVTAPSSNDAVGAAQGVLGGASALAGPASGLAAATPFVGLGLTLASTYLSSVGAKKAANAQAAAEREAAKAAEEMKRLTAQNEYAAIQVPVQAYERAFREGTASNAEAINALAQDQRSLIGGIQGVQEATIEGQAKNTEALADRLYSDAMTKAGVRMGINQNLAKIASDEVSGAQIAAMAAEKAKIAQQQATLQGVGGLITQGMGMIGTYGGLANEGDKLQTLLGGTSFAKPSAQPNQAQLLQMLSQNPNLLMQLLGQQKSTLG